MALIAGDPKLQGAYFPFFCCLGASPPGPSARSWCGSWATVGGFTLIAWVAVMGAPQLFLASWALEENQWQLIRDANWVVWGTVVYLGLAMTALGYGIWYHLLGIYPINQVAPFLLLLPVTSVLGSVVVLGESLSLTVAIGGAIVIAGVAFIVLEKAGDS